MSGNSCVFLAMNSVRRYATLKSLAKEFGLDVSRCAFEICDPEMATTTVLITDWYEGMTSSGLWDGTRGTNACRFDQFMEKAPALGAPVFLLRTLLPVSTVVMPDVSAKLQSSSFRCELITTGDIKKMTILPLNVILVVQ